MQRVRSWLIRIFAAVPILALVIWLTLTPGNPEIYPPESDPRPVWVVDHGWHSGVIIGQAELRAAALSLELTEPDAADRIRWLTTRYPAAEWIEVGWGDAEFYQQTPTIGDVDPWLGAKALLMPTEAALQIVPGWGPPDGSFVASDKQRVLLSLDGFRKLALQLAEAVEYGVSPTGQSLYGEGHFFPARQSYHLFRTCNHWVSNLLRAAGVPSSGIPGTFSSTLMMELRMRAFRE
ncbi:MAG: DUF2459 domain-containing protein [Pseudomonadota bacterium]